MMVMEITFMTHRGIVREENQDAVFVSGIIRTGNMVAPEVHNFNYEHLPILLSVIDGIGGHQGGALAAKIVSETLAENANKKNFFAACASVDENKQRLFCLFEEASRKLKTAAQASSLLSEMGAVVGGILMHEKSLLAFNCGDCRAYRLRRGYLERITHDHSIVQELFEQGEINEEEMREHPRKNVITAAISANSRIKLKLYAKELSLCEGDIFFLCSDGVWETLSKEELTMLFTQDTSLLDIAQNLFDALLLANCRDNISFICWRIER